MTTIYYLEQKSPSSLIAKTDAKGLEIREAEIKQFQLNRFLYQYVGGPWKWTDRLVWTDDAWREYAENDNLRTWVAYMRGTPAGYVELQQQGDGDVEIALLGLAPRFLDLGLGGYFLSKALELAWSWQGTKRVWLHTCTLDHPHALDNYLARGMQIYRSEET
jgi:GNAT superfamily N-acetyltransferase